MDQPLNLSAENQEPRNRTLKNTADNQRQTDIFLNQASMIESNQPADSSGIVEQTLMKSGSNLVRDTTTSLQETILPTGVKNSQILRQNFIHSNIYQEQKNGSEASVTGSGTASAAATAMTENRLARTRLRRARIEHFI